MRYETFWPRFRAGFIDGVIIAVFTFPLAYLDNYVIQPEQNYSVAIIWLFISYFSPLAYYIYFHTTRGQTPGKLLSKVKLLDISEERIPNFRQAFVREIGYVILIGISFGLLAFNLLAREFYWQPVSGTLGQQIYTWSALSWFLVEGVSMLTNYKRRAVHDYIARTVVVRTT